MMALIVGRTRICRPLYVASRPMYGGAGSEVSMSRGIPKGMMISKTHWVAGVTKKSGRSGRSNLTAKESMMFVGVFGFHV